MHILTPAWRMPEGVCQRLPTLSPIIATLGRRTPHTLPSVPQQVPPDTQQEVSAPGILPQAQQRAKAPTVAGAGVPLSRALPTALNEARAVPPPAGSLSPTHRTQSAKAPATLSLSRTRKLPSRPARASSSSAAARLRSRWYQAGAGLPRAAPGPAPPGPGAPHAEAMARAGFSAARAHRPAPSALGRSALTLGPGPGTGAGDRA